MCPVRGHHNLVGLLSAVRVVKRASLHCDRGSRASSLLEKVCVVRLLVIGAIAVAIAGLFALMDAWKPGVALSFIWMIAAH